MRKKKTTHKKANKEINREKKLFESINHPSAKQSNDFYFRDNFGLYWTVQQLFKRFLLLVVTSIYLHVYSLETHF